MYIIEDYICQKTFFIVFYLLFGWLIFCSFQAHCIQPIHANLERISLYQSSLIKLLVLFLNFKLNSHLRFDALFETKT